MNRRTFLATAVTGACAPILATGAAAAPPGTRRRVCVLAHDDGTWARETVPALLKELASLGIPERNLQIQVCAAEERGVSVSQCAAELARSGCDAFFTLSTNNTRVLQRTTRTIPVVTGVGDPVGSGFATSLARPGGNITGLSYATPEWSAKLLEFARLMKVKTSAIALLAESNNESFQEISKPMEAEARRHGTVPRRQLVAAMPDVERAFREMQGRGERLVVSYLSDGGAGSTEEITELAARNRIGLLCNSPEWVRKGALLSYDLRFRNELGRLASQLALVLRGARPAETPFELPEVTNLVVNRATAARLGLVVPPDILALANEVIG